MKNFWKVLGVAALAVGLTPYKVEKDEERGEKRYQALLWQATVSSGEGEEKKVDVNLGFKSPADKEAHLFSDELSVAYGVCAEGAEKAAETVQEAKEAVCDAVETACEAVEDAAE
ncbi:MAG: hypothetical protein HFF65_03055 [Oscillospiraceae bacterium]|jgi:hypothetical protein|nr:hypothetical protein [Oscillospiraceae bacterium]